MLLKNNEKFIQSLEDIFEINIEENKDILLKKQEIKFLDLYLDEFWQYLENGWQELDNIAIDFYDSYLNYKSNKLNWKVILEDSENLSEIDFILKHSQVKSSLAQLKAENKLDDDYIQFEKKEILKNPPKIINNHDLNKFKRFGLYGFKFYENGPLKINLHLRLNKGISFNFLILLTLTIKYPSVNEEFSMEFINDYYHSFIITYELINLLSEIGYNEVEQDYANREVYVSDDWNYRTITSNNINFPQNNRLYEPFSNSSPNRRAYPPIEFKSFYLNLLHNSAHELFSHLSSNLDEIKNIIERYSNILNPKSYYDTFENELKDFMVKGKNLFLKTEEIFYEKLIPEKKIGYLKPKKKKITTESIYDLFLKEYNTDIKNGVDSEDAGFRSKKEFFDKYQDKLNVSQGTFYKNFEKIATKSNRFEKRQRKKSGGGDEFRILVDIDKTHARYKKDITQMSLATNDSDKESYEIMVKFEEAMFYYTDRQYNVAKKILKKIYSPYPEPLKIESIVYSQILYYLGDLYFKMGNLDKALNFFKEGDEIESQSERNLYKFNVEILKIQRWKGDFSNLSEKVNDLDKKIQTIFESKLKKINEEFKFIDNSKIEDLDIHYISQLKMNPSFRRNQTFLEIINLELNQLKLNFLKLDLIRREISIESADNPIKEIEQNGKVVKVIPEKIQNLLDKGYDIIESSLKTKFYRENQYLLPFYLFKHHFNNIKEVAKIPFYEGENYFDLEPVCPLYYFRFLEAIVNAESYFQVPEYLNKYEIDMLDIESRMEYYIKISKSKLERQDSIIHVENLLNIYINLKTLMDYVINLGEKSNSNVTYLITLAEKVRNRAIEERHSLEKAIKESREKAQKRKRRV